MTMRRMIRKLWLAAALVSCSFALANAAPNLDGEWHTVSAVVGGRPVPAQQLAVMNLQIVGNRMIPAGSPTDVATYTIDDTHQPAWFDTSDAQGVTNLGIYKLEGDRLTLCAAWPTDGRPVTFGSPAGSRVVLAVMQRVSPATAPTTAPSTDQ